MLVIRVGDPKPDPPWGEAVYSSCWRLPPACGWLRTQWISYGFDSPCVVHFILIVLNRLFLESHSQSSTQTHTLQYLGLSLFAYTTLPWNIEPVQSPHLSTISPASYLVGLTLNPFTWKKGNYNITRWSVPCRWGYPGGKSGKEPTCQYRRCRWDPWVAKIPCSMKWQLAPVLLSGEFHGQRSLAGYSPWGRRESNMAEHTPYRRFVRTVYINTSRWSVFLPWLHLGWAPNKWWLWLARMVTYIKVGTQGNSVSDSIPSVHTLLNHLINAGLIGTQVCRVSDFLNR